MVMAGLGPTISFRRARPCPMIVTPRQTRLRGVRRLRTPRRTPARVALHARAVAHQREVAAFAAGLALVAFGAGFGAFLARRGFGLRARVERGLHFERLRRRKLCFGLGFE